MNKRFWFVFTVILVSLAIAAGVALVAKNRADSQEAAGQGESNPTPTIRVELSIAPTATSTAQPTPTTPPTRVAPTPTAVPATQVPTPEPTVVEVVAADPGMTSVTASDGSAVMLDLSLRENWEAYPSPAYALQVALRDQRPEVQPNPRPDDFSPVTFTIPVFGEMVFFGHGDFAVGDSEFAASSCDGCENVTILTNETGNPLSFTVANYAHSGYSVWSIISGEHVNGELLARYTLGRSSHCGLGGPTRFGCQQVTLHQVLIAATGEVTHTPTVYTIGADALPLDNTHLTTAELNDDWATKTSAQALADEQHLFSQPVTVLGETASLGVTYGKYAVVIAESLTLTGPDGDIALELPAESGKLYLVVLSNSVGDTAVFRLTNITNGYMYEYTIGAVPHTELLARAMIDSTTTAVDVHEAKYERILIVLDTTSSGPTHYTDPLP